MESNTTYTEMQFIDVLGQWSECKYERLDILRKYITACKKRVIWGNIDKEYVVKYAWKCLDEAKEELNG